ncbi:MAG: sulfatase [Pyrinomonadaceae bacterium MAG19_C2-C3]|nr:sulfatase [Pyrinomonadaceae bacterium MAG19_C2-C3]
MNSIRSTYLARLVSSGIIGTLFLTLLFSPVTASVRQKNFRPPNIVYIMADDLGWRELNAYGNRFNETPNLNRLAAQGIKFTNAYAAAPICSPTRAAFMTGQYPGRTGITNYIEAKDTNYLKPSYTTINERLKQSGYRTALIGKWHLTGDYEAGPEGKGLGRPQLHGWDEVIASETKYIGPGDYFYPYFFMPDLPERAPEFTGRKPDEPEYLTDRLNAEAVDFIKRNKERPFFLYLSHYAPHTQLAGKPALLRKYQAKPDSGANARGNYNHPNLAAMLESIDDGVGMITRTLDELGLAENTLVVFTSDNGGEFGVTTNSPLWAGKSTIYEGGLRVPQIMRFPGKIPNNAVSDVPTITVDYFPTFMELAGARPDTQQPVDGTSLTPLFKAGGRLERDTIYFHYPLAQPRLLAARSSGAVRHGDYKLIEFFDTGEIQLFNLREDIGEQWNLAAQMPQKVTEMRRMISDWRKRANVSMQPMRAK